MAEKIKIFSVFLILNMLLSFLLEPARGASEIMWEGYYKEEELDTVFIGSSLCQGTFDPYVFNRRLGVKSYNMGTPLQAMPQTVKALETALKDHDIKTVIFGMGFSTLKLEALAEAELTFEKARTRKLGGIEGVKEKILNTSESQIPTKGYQNHKGDVLNYDNRWELNTYRYYDARLNAEMMEEFERLMKICNQHEVDLIVVNTPHPYFDVIACYESYESNQDEVKALCEKYDADYYEFNLAKPEVFVTRPEYYSDYEHLNWEGSQAFCEQLCDFLIRRANGEKMEAYFYSVDEFLELHAEWLKDWQEYYW